jgi:peptide/nickel transport system substrate-binding protein
MKKVCLIVALLSILSSCSEKRDKTLVIYGVEGIEKGYKPGETIIDNLLFSAIYLQDDRLDIHRILVDEARPSKDKKVWTLHLRKGVRLHNGEIVTARDVASSIENRSIRLPGEARIKRISVEDEERIRIEFEVPMATPYSVLSNIYVYSNKTPMGFPAGSGPFKFRRWLDKGLEIEAFDEYFEGRPGLDGIIYIHEPDERKRLHRLLKGDADLLTHISPDTARFLMRDDRFHVSNVPVPYYVAVFFNNSSLFFKDRLVREAISMAIDRDKIIEKALNGAGIKASGPFIQGTWPASPDVSPYGYEPKRAARLLKEAGGKRPRIRVIYIKEMEEFKKVVDVIAQQLYEVGIEAEFVPMSMARAYGKPLSTEGYDAILTMFNTGLDPDSVRAVWASGGGYNISNYSNAEVDRLFKEGRETGDIEERERIYNRIHEIIHDDAPAAFLYHPVWYAAVSRRFKGAEDFKGDPYSWYRIKDWSVNEDIR